MPLDAVELEWIKSVAKVKTEERKSIKERLEQHLVQSGRAAEPSKLDATATPSQARADASKREADRARREDELQNVVQDKAEIGANAVYAEAAASEPPVGGGPVALARIAIRTKAANRLAKKRAKLDVSDPQLRERAENEVLATQPTLTGDPLKAAVDEQARKHLDIRRDKMIADQLNVKLGRPPYKPYAADGALTNVPMDPALKRAVEERKTQIEIDNAVSREIEKKIAAQVPATDHPYTRNEKIEKIVIDTAAKYGETNLAHLIGRHAAERKNPSTGAKIRTNDDMVSRFVTGVAPDQKNAPSSTVKPGTGTVTGALASGGSTTVPDYQRVGRQTGPSSSQHASAKAALFMMEEAAAEAARLGRQVAAQEAVRLGTQVGPDNFTAHGAESVKVDIGTQNMGGESRGAYQEKGKLGKSYTVSGGWKLQNSDRGTPLQTADIRNLISRTVVTNDNPSAVATLIPDLIHGGVNLMTMFTKKEALSHGSKLTKRVGQNDVTVATRGNTGANNAQAQLAARDAQARLAKLTQPGGPQKTAEAAAVQAETNKKNAEKTLKDAVDKLPPEKQQLAAEVQAAAVEAEQAKRDKDRAKMHLDKAVALAQAAEVDHYERAIPEVMGAFEKARDAVPTAKAELTTAESELQAAELALSTDPTNVAKRSQKEQKEAKAAEARVKARQAEANYELVRIEVGELVKGEAALDEVREMLARRQAEYDKAASRADESAKKRDDTAAQCTAGAPANDAEEVKGALTAAAKSSAVAAIRQKKLEKINRAVESAQANKDETQNALAVANAVAPAAAVPPNTLPAGAAVTAFRQAAAKGADEAIAEVNALIARQAASPAAATSAVAAARIAAIQAAGKVAADATAAGDPVNTVQPAARAAAFAAAQAAAQKAHDNQVATEAKAKLTAELTNELQARTGDQPNDARGRFDRKAAEQKAAVEKSKEAAKEDDKVRQIVVDEVKKDSAATEAKAKESTQKVMDAHQGVQAIAARVRQADKNLKQANAKHKAREKQRDELEATLSTDKTVASKEKRDAAERKRDELVKGPGETTAELIQQAEILKNEIAKLEETLPKREEQLKAVKEKGEKARAEKEQVDSALKELTSIPSSVKTVAARKKTADTLRAEAADLEKQAAEATRKTEEKAAEAERLAQDAARRRGAIEELKKTRTDENAAEVDSAVKSAEAEAAGAEEQAKRVKAEAEALGKEADAARKRHEEKNKASQAANEVVEKINKKEDLTNRLEALKRDIGSASIDARNLQQEIDEGKKALPDKREAKQLKDMEASIARSSEQRKAEEALQSADGEHKKVTANREAALERRDEVHKLVEESGKALVDAQAAKDESDHNDPAALQKAQEELEAARVQSRNDRRAAEESRRVAEQMEAEQTNRREVDAAQIELAEAEHEIRVAAASGGAATPKAVARKDYAEALVRHAEAAAAKRRADVKLHAAEAQSKRITAALPKAEAGVEDIREKRRQNALAALTPQETKALDRVTKMQASKQKADQKVTKWKNEVQSLEAAAGIEAGVVGQKKIILDGIV